MLTDCLREVFSYLEYGSAYKSITRVCTEWYRLAREMYPRAEVTMANHMSTLMMKLPVMRERVGDILARNETITRDFILRTREFVDWGFDTDDIFAYLPYMRNATAWGVDLEFILKNLPKLAMLESSKVATSVPGLTWDMIRERMWFPWDWEYVFEHIMKWEEFQRDFIGNPGMFLKVNIFRYVVYKCITMNPTVTKEIILANMYFPWNWEYSMIYNPNVDYEFYLATFNQRWNHRWIMETSWYPIELAVTYPISYNKHRADLPKEYYTSDKINLFKDGWIVMLCPSVQLDDLIGIDNADELIRGWVESNTNMNMKVIWDHPELPWESMCLSGIKDLDWKYVVEHPEYPWDWEDIAKNRRVHG